MKSQKILTITRGRAWLITLVAAAGFMFAAAPNAAAEEDEPFVGVIVADLGELTAEVTLDCANENPVKVTVKNTTLFPTQITIRIDGEDVLGLGPLGAIETFSDNYFAAENDAIRVVVTVWADELANESLKVNCVPPDPWFEFSADCDAGEAWVELGNNGPDVGIMGVHYTNLPYAGGPIAPGDSTIQHLGVEPNQFADFSIEVDGEAIYSDGYFFDCPEPEVLEVDEDEHPSETPAVPEVTKPEEEPPADDELVEATPEIEGTEVIAGVGDAEELATAANLTTRTDSSTSGAILVGLLLALGLALTVGSIAALRMRR